MIQQIKTVFFSAPNLFRSKMLFFFERLWLIPNISFLLLGDAAFFPT